jgi:hypothetical protein
MALEDYGALIQSGMNLVPDYNKQLAFKVGLDSERLQQQHMRQELAAEQEKQIRERTFQQDLTVAMQKPDASSISGLMMKYPEFADKLKSSWDVRDEAAKQGDLTQLGEIYSAASSGNWELAGKAAQRRLDADKAAGQGDPLDQEIVDAINSGDPTKQKAVVGLIGVHLAAATGPEHFGTVYGALNGKEGGFTLDAGATRYDAQGHVIAESPYLKGPDGSLAVKDDPSGTPAGTPATGAPGGFEHAVETVLGNEGGYAPSDMNGKPVNFGINQGANPDVDVKNLTRDQAKQLYHDRYWVPSGAEDLPANLQTPYFDVYIRNPGMAKKALKDSGGDPQKFMAISSGYFQKLAQKPSGQKYAKAWAARDANNAAIAAGGAPADAPPAASGGQGAPAGYHWLVPPKGPTTRIMTPEEVKAQGLPATQQYKINTATGDIQPIPGTAEAQDALDPSTTTFYAEQILAGGDMPALGMGKSAAAARQAIMREVSHLAQARGLGGKDLATQRAHYKAAQGAIKTMETQADTIGANEETALANGQQFLDRSAEVTGQSDFPVINSISQWAKRHTGDPAVRAMDAAWNTFTTEYAKVVAGSPSGAGTLSDSARHEAQEIMRTSDNMAQKRAVFKQMQADMANRIAAIHGTISRAYDKLTVIPSSSSSAPSDDLPRGAKVVGTYHGKRVIEVNGKRMVEQ